MPALNPHGVIERADEIRRWQGAPGYVCADIRLARYGAEWLWATGYTLPQGGQSGPLSPKWRDQHAASYELALGAAIAQLIQQVDRYCEHHPPTKMARELRAWLRSGAPRKERSGH